MAKKLTFEEALEHNNAHFVLIPKGLMNERTGDLIEEGVAKLSSEQKTMLAFAIEHWGEHIVCDYLQLNVPSGRLPGGNAKDKDFSRDSVQKKILPKQPIETTEYLKLNWDYKNNGRWYEFLEKETEEYQKTLDADIKRRKLNAEKAFKAKQALESGLSTLAFAAEKSVEKEEKATKIYVVTIDNEVQEYVGDPADFNVKDYLATGTKKECNDFVNKKK